MRLSTLSIAALLLAISAAALAQTVTAVIPNSARAVVSVGGWECLRGFTDTGQGCTPVKVPVHAYLDASGEDWSCDRTYIKTDLGCEVVKVPANAHTDDDMFGNGYAV